LGRQDVSCHPAGIRQPLGNQPTPSRRQATPATPACCTLGRLAPAQLAVTLTDEQRTLLLDLDSELHIYPANPVDPAGTVIGTADTVLRLVYGRHRPGTDAVTAAGLLAVDDLRALFSGF
jgi:hypothetical protein